MRNAPLALAVFGLLFATRGEAATYYVDAAAGNDRNAGTSPASAWKTLDKVATESRNRKVRKNGFPAGDQVLFKSGQTFASSGYPIITVAGAAAAPVLIGSYGTGAAPRFDNTGSGIYDIGFKVSGTHATLSNLALVKSNAANVTEIGAFLSGTGMRVTGCDFSGVGIGLKLEGSGHLVEQSVFHDLTMVFADAAPDNDYGAMGIVISNGSAIEIRNNRFERLRQPSPDYGTDGSALEIFNAASNVRFHHNLVSTVDAFTEIGGSIATATVQDVRYHHNLVLDYVNIAYFHNNAGGSTYGLNVHDIRFEHNTFSKTSATMASWLLGFGMPPAANDIWFRNNIVEHRNSSGLFYNAGALVHQGNLYGLVNTSFGDPSFAFSATEWPGDPSFRNAAAGDYRLGAGSLAIDVGLSLGYTQDLDGLVMPVGTAPDLGAYEFR